MAESKRPLSITILACVYLVVGIAGFAFHFREMLALQRDSIAVEVTELLAITCGIFMLRGHNWARWLAVAWIAFHVAISIMHPLRELIVHAVLFVVIAWILLRPAAGRYFRGTQVNPV